VKNRPQAGATYPDLLEVGIGVTGTDVAVTPQTHHPYATVR
jgi:hypothetical protein